MPTLDRDIADWVEREFSQRAADYTKFQDFYDGKHTVELTDRLKDFLKTTESEFNTNFCEVVVDAMADRVMVSGFDTDEEGEAPPVAVWINNVWAKNRMDAEQRVVHNQAAVKGDAYCITDWDEDRNMPEFFFDDADRVRPRYDPANRRRLLYVARQWSVDGQDWLNLYYPDRIEKYIGKGSGSGWEERREEDEEWPIMWTMPGGEPIGIPVVHFRNKPRQNQYGRSELDSIVPLQIALDKALVDLLMVVDTLGFQQRWLSNVRTPAAGFKIYPGSVWDLTPKPGSDASSVQVGQFPSESPEGLIAAMNELIGEVAAISRTPHHLFKLNSGNFPSGEALQTAEQGLVKKVEDRHIVYGNAWEDTIMTGMRLHNARVEGEAELNLDAILTTLWGDHQTRNELAHVQSVQAKVDIGISTEQALRELGYDEVLIAQMMDEREEQKARDANLGSAIIREFNGGGAQPVVP